ncbi:MAG: nucleotidyltransferase family protein [Vicinamibacterales bacterium]
MGQLSGIAGIVLAAGRSSRMGLPKALLPCMPGGETFVARAIRTLREGGVSDVVVVGRHEDEALRTVVARVDPSPYYAENPSPERGQLSSLLVGIDDARMRGADAVIVMPVDIPEVRPDTVAAVLAASERTAAPIVRATHGGRHGHPVIFRAVVFGELRAADPTIGARAVLRAHGDRILDVEVDDPGVLRDVDLPEDYVRLFGRPL